MQVNATKPLLSVQKQHGSSAMSAVSHSQTTVCARAAWVVCHECSLT